MIFFYDVENLTPLRHTSLYAFLKCSPQQPSKISPDEAKTNQLFVCKCMKTAQPIINKESYSFPLDKMAAFLQTIFS